MYLKSRLQIFQSANLNENALSLILIIFNLKHLAQGAFQGEHGVHIYQTLRLERRDASDGIGVTISKLG